MWKLSILPPDFEEESDITLTLCTTKAYQSSASLQESTSRGTQAVTLQIHCYFFFSPQMEQFFSGSLFSWNMCFQNENSRLYLSFLIKLSFFYCLSKTVSSVRYSTFRIFHTSFFHFLCRRVYSAPQFSVAGLGVKMTGRVNEYGGCEEFLHLSIEAEGFWWFVIMLLLPQCCPGLWLRLAFITVQSLSWGRELQISKVLTVTNESYCICRGMRMERVFVGFCFPFPTVFCSSTVFCSLTSSQ